MSAVKLFLWEIFQIKILKLQSFAKKFNAKNIENVKTIEKGENDINGSKLLEGYNSKHQNDDVETTTAPLQTQNTAKISSKDFVDFIEKSILASQKKKLAKFDCVFRIRPFSYRF